jgi:hypothetical protein
LSRNFTAAAGSVHRERTTRLQRRPVAARHPPARRPVVGISPFAVARTGDALREGVRNGTTTSETEIISNVGSTNAPKGGYSTRQSNLSNSGGGAVYGCRSSAGGSAANPPRNPCLRANNLSNGFAFELHASRGDVVGLITAGGGGDGKRPFTTNATGVATGLNADRVDGQSADELTRTAVAATRAITPFAQVNANGTVGQTRGVPANGVTHVLATGVYAVPFTGDFGACAWSATLTDPAGGDISAVPAVAGGNTTVTVRTANSAGIVGDRAFHLSATC